MKVSKTISLRIETLKQIQAYATQQKISFSQGINIILEKGLLLLDQE